MNRLAVYYVPSVLLFCTVLLSVSSCQNAPLAGPDQASNTVQQLETNEVAKADEPPAAPIGDEVLDRLRNEEWHGDIDGLRERRYIRALVFYNKTNFFYDGPQPRGVTYEALKEFEKFVNKKLNTGNKPIYMVFLPVTRTEALERMKEGKADIAASNLPITPELQQIGDFSDPLRSDAGQVVVTGPSAGPVTSVDDLAGKEVFVRKISRYWKSLEQLNSQFKQSGKQLIKIKEADPNLEDEDILNMVNSGVVGITVTDDLLAAFWSKVYEQINVHDDLKLATGEQIGWLVQKGTPNFLALINEFVKDHKIGTSFGNTVLNRYMKETKWAKNNVAPAEIEKYKDAAGFFKKYGDQYNFDLLLIAAQAYQESTIDQSVRSPAGAVGVMQIKPSTAEDKPVGLSNVDSNIDNNIHAGVKYMDYIMRTNFKDAKFDKNNRSFFALAAYNAGPARIAQLRKKATAEGLNPDVWFNNVEIIAAREIGAETVTYVSNIYKYYVGYKLHNDVITAKSIGAARAKQN